MIERLESYIKKELSAFLRESVSLEEGIFLSVTRVIVDDSLEKAEVFVSVFPEKFSQNIFKELRLLHKEARKFLASRIKRHKIPQIQFMPDKNIDAESRIEKLLEKK